MKEQTKQNIFVTFWIAIFFVFVALFVNAANVDAERFHDCVESEAPIEACI